MRARFFGLALVSVFLLPLPAVAQEIRVIRGIVLDAADKALTGASVRLLDRIGTTIASTSTDEHGAFAFPGVSAGQYSVIAEHHTLRSPAVIVAVDRAGTLDVELRLAPNLFEAIVVQAGAEAPPVTTRTTLSGDAVRRIPTRLRSRGLPQVLATLPGWSSEDNGLVHVRGVDDGFLYVQDGVPIYDRLDAAFGIAPDPVSIGVMNVVTGYVPPEYGLKSGAVIEVQSDAVRPSEWLGVITLGGGSDAGRSLRLRSGGPIGARVGLGFSLGAERSDRFLDPVHPDNFHNEGDVVSGDARLTVAAGDRDLVRANVVAGRSRYDVPHTDLEEDAGQDQRQRIAQYGESGSWQRSWNDRVVSSVSVYHRHVNAVLSPSPNDVPITSSSTRKLSRVGGLASLAYDAGRHGLKFGFEGARLRLDENFSFAVTNDAVAEDEEISGAARRFTPSAPFLFADSAAPALWSVYVQDRVRAHDRLSIDFGVRVDWTRLLVPASQVSPRVGAAYRVSGATTLRASVNRLFQPPQPEYILLSSSEEARALSPFVNDDEDPAEGGAELQPERQTAVEAGVEHWIGRTMRLDAAYWYRRVANYTDPNVLLGTTIVFPNSVASGRAKGLDLRVEVLRQRGWSAQASYTNSRVVQFGPINGGLFLEDEVIEIGPGTAFVPDHDQRHTASVGLAYEPSRWGLSMSVTGRYESGTPLEVDEDDEDELMERPGADRVDFDTGRVKPRTILDVTVAKVLPVGARARLSLRASMLNVTNRKYALNFGNPFSGTHFGAPRTFLLETGLAF